MASEITKDKLLNDLNELKKITDDPTLYLSSYFNELRSEMYREFASIQQGLQNDQEKKKQLDELWQQILTKIDSFVQNCIRNSYDLEENKTGINNIETTLSNLDLINIKEAKEAIEKEEINLLANLFKNKTIIFANNEPRHYKSISKNKNYQKTNGKNNQLTNKQLVILNDEFISKKALEKR